MKKCLKGHRYPDTMSFCPVCAKEGELQTVFGGPPPNNIAPDTAFPDQKKPSEGTQPTGRREENPPPPEKNGGTVILRRDRLPVRQILVGWMVELDTDEIPVNSFQLFERETVIGRNSDNDILLNDDSVSGRHCTISFEKGKLIIIDNHSSNGTFVNDQPVDTQLLAEGDIVNLGRSRFRVKYL